MTSDPRALPRDRRAVLALWALDVKVAEQTGVQVGARALWLHVHVHEGQLAAVVTPKRHVARWGAVHWCRPKLTLWTAKTFSSSEGELGPAPADGERVHAGHFGVGGHSPPACSVAASPRLGLAVPTCRPKELDAARNFGEEQACWRRAAQHGVPAAQDSGPIQRKRGGQHGVAHGEAGRSELVCVTHMFLKLRILNSVHDSVSGYACY